MSGVCDDNFGAREIGPLYNLAMQTSLDEINSTRHMDMRFNEFVEALARVADKAIHRDTQEFPVDRDRTSPPPKAKPSAPSKQATRRTPAKASAMDSVAESQSRASSLNRASTNLRMPSTAQLPALPTPEQDLAPYQGGLQSVRQETAEHFHPSITEDNGLNKSAVHAVQGGKLDFNQDLQQDLAEQAEAEEKPRILSALQGLQ